MAQTYPLALRRKSEWYPCQEGGQICLSHDGEGTSLVTSDTYAPEDGSPPWGGLRRQALRNPTLKGSLHPKHIGQEAPLLLCEPCTPEGGAYPHTWEGAPLQRYLVLWRGAGAQTPMMQRDTLSYLCRRVLSSASGCEESTPCYFVNSISGREAPTS